MFLQTVRFGCGVGFPLLHSRPKDSVITCQNALHRGEFIALNQSRRHGECAEYDAQPPRKLLATALHFHAKIERKRGINSNSFKNRRKETYNA